MAEDNVVRPSFGRKPPSEQSAQVTDDGAETTLTLEDLTEEQYRAVVADFSFWVSQTDFGGLCVTN